MTGAYTEANSGLTVAQAVGYWVDTRRSEVKTSTWNNYRHIALYIIGLLLAGTTFQRRSFTLRGEVPRGAQLLEMLGSISDF